MSVVEELGKYIYDWFLGGISITTIVIVLVLLLVLVGVLKVAGSYIVQGLLLLVVWLPAVVVTVAVDVSVIEPKPIVPLKGIGTLLFPYVWDVLFGYFKNTAYLIMIVLSYIALLHLALIFVHKARKSVYYSPLIAYFLLLGLGLGMLNFHAYMIDCYLALCTENGIHPAFPITFFSVIVILFIALKYRNRILMKNYK